MSIENFNAWGWRIPFLTSALLVFFSYLMRKKMEETPIFTQMQATNNILKSPIKEALSSASNRRLMLGIIFGGNTAQSTIMQTAQFVTLYYLQRAVKVEEHISYIILAIALFFGTPFFQWASM